MPVHLGTIAVDGAGKPIAQELADCRRRAAEADRKDGERGSHGRPQPSPGGSLFGRRFVHEDLRLIGQSGVEFPVGLCECLGDLVLHLDGQGRAAGLAEQVFKEQCGELLSNVVFVRRESGGVLQDSVGEDSSLDDERELMACVEASPATCR